MVSHVDIVIQASFLVLGATHCMWRQGEATSALAHILSRSRLDAQSRVVGAVYGPCSTPKVMAEDVFGGAGPGLPTTPCISPWSRLYTRAEWACRLSRGIRLRFAVHCITRSMSFGPRIPFASMLGVPSLGSCERPPSQSLCFHPGSPSGFGRLGVWQYIDPVIEYSGSLKESCRC